MVCLHAGVTKCPCKNYSWPVASLLGADQFKPYHTIWWQCRCQEDPVRLPSGWLEKTTRSSPHHVAQHRPTGSATTPPYAPRSSRFGSEPPSVGVDVDVWRYAILELHARNDEQQHSLMPGCPVLGQLDSWVCKYVMWFCLVSVQWWSDEDWEMYWAANSHFHLSAF